ncbi:MAG: hypothetical protein KDK61_08535 [Simkania sp.]|nr:hypothetical protein [Simkania sp.]
MFATTSKQSITTNIDSSAHTSTAPTLPTPHLIDQCTPITLPKQSNNLPINQAEAPPHALTSKSTQTTHPMSRTHPPKTKKPSQYT